MLHFYKFLLIKNGKNSIISPLLLFTNKRKFKSESLSIGKNAYQLLYFGQYEQSLNLAKLAVKINKNDEKLWLILSEAQVANKLYKQALSSINKAQKINPKNSETYFAKSNIYLKISKLKDEINKVVISRILNPKWINGMKDNGY